MTGARLRRSVSLPSLGASAPPRRGVRARVAAALARMRGRAVAPLPSASQQQQQQPLQPQSSTSSTTPSVPDIPPQKLARKNLLLRCLEFSADGACTSRFVTRQTVLDAARERGGPDLVVPRAAPRSPVSRRAAPSRAAPQKRGRHAHSRARAPPPVTAMFKARHYQQQGRNALTMRDLRQVDPDFTAKPALWVRQHALVVSLESVRAIILCDRMFLFDPDNEAVQGFVKYLRRYLPGGGEQAFIPFEFRALDAILENACYKLARTFGEIKPDIHHTLGMLPTKISPDQLERLRQLEQALNYFYVRARKVQHVLQAVLDEDDDMADMYLSEKSLNPESPRNPIHHDEVETLLETHLQTVDDLTSKAELLNRTIDDTEDLIEIHLDTMQNRLLLVDLIITAITTILSFGSMVTGVFGMNLQLPHQMRFMPSSQYYFYGTVTGTAVAMGVSLLVLTKWCREQGLRTSANTKQGRWRRRGGSRRASEERLTEDGRGRGLSAVRTPGNEVLAQLRKKPD